MREKLGDLGKRVDKNEIKEQLERFDGAISGVRRVYASDVFAVSVMSVGPAQLESVKSFCTLHTGDDHSGQGIRYQEESP